MRSDWNDITSRLTEQACEERRALEAAVNNTDTCGPELDPKVCRARLEQRHGQVWDSFELARDFEVEAFSSPLVVVRRRADGVRGTLVFQHDPRFYWKFEPS